MSPTPKTLNGCCWLYGCGLGLFLLCTGLFHVLRWEDILAAALIVVAMCWFSFEAGKIHQRECDRAGSRSRPARFTRGSATVPDDVEFLKKIVADPDDDNHRLVYADYLEERAGTAACPRCLGTGSRALDPAELKARYGARAAGKIAASSACGRCEGAGRVPDALATRAQFIRLQIQMAGTRCTCTCEYEHGIGCPASALPGLRRKTAAMLAENYAPWFMFPGLPRPVLLSAFSVGWYSQRLPAAPAMTGEVARGFVSTLRVDVDDWLARADRVAWSPMELPCRNCRGTGDGYGGCGACAGTGRRVEPFPEAALPLKVVHLSGTPYPEIASFRGARWWRRLPSLGENVLDVIRAEWPWLEFKFDS